MSSWTITWSSAEARARNASWPAPAASANVAMMAGRWNHRKSHFVSIPRMAPCLRSSFKSSMWVTQAKYGRPERMQSDSSAYEHSARTILEERLVV
jgi:hypothetical protein